MLMQTPKPRLYTRLAAGEAEIEAAQRLRFDVFYRERGRAPRNAGAERDQDRFDAFSDHLLVFRQSAEQGPGEDDSLVGTYRLLRQEVAEQHGGFYSAQEFDLALLLARQQGLRFLELGRSCVLAEYRSMPVIGLLWQGIWDYVRRHGIDVMTGCASLEGTDIAAHRQVLQFLGTHCRAPEDWQVAARPGHGIPLVDENSDPVDVRKVLRAMPPLVRGYLGLGCHVASEAFIDHDFNTVDVLIILPVARINPRYFAHFGAPA